MRGVHPTSSARRMDVHLPTRAQAPTSIYLGAFGLPWVTEVNTNLLDRRSVPTNVSCWRAVATRDVPVVFWFCWSDGMVPPFGLLDTSGTPKPAYTRYQLLATPW
jgi:hypothetical protein